ncbi:uncharacterized protein LOC110720271 [Chenopodium quinoa]|uniref:uncharacterized protein LOC110720271 n=1 Tax=Chenopodium quinoa TaxID=63459 RepID=UPI000B77648B|nr:uncharacterized protein LOC110720271 [Chenopodium quinoa]
MANTEEAETTTINGDQKQQHEQEEEHSSNNNKHEKSHLKGEGSKNLYDAVSSLLFPIFFPDPHSSSSIYYRTKASFRENLPHLREASRDTGLNILRWARNGSSFRLLLVLSVGTITLLTLTGVLVFLLFLAAATVNAIILSLFMSLAAAGGFLAIFFACLAGIYIGALAIAFFVISSVTIAAVITAVIVTGWIGFFWTLWLVIKKGASLAKHSVTVTGSALTAYTSGRRHHHHD